MRLFSTIFQGGQKRAAFLTFSFVSRQKDNNNNNNNTTMQNKYKTLLSFVLLFKAVNN